MKFLKEALTGWVVGTVIGSFYNVFFNNDPNCSPQVWAIIGVINLFTLYMLIKPR